MKPLHNWIVINPIMIFEVFNKKENTHWIDGFNYGFNTLNPEQSETQTG